MSAEIVTAVEKLLSYLRQAETRRILETEYGMTRFHQGADKLQKRYHDAVESGEDQDFVKALEDAPLPPSFVIVSMQERGII